VLLEECELQRVGVEGGARRRGSAVGQGQGGEAAEHAVRGRGGDAEGGGEQVAAGAHERVVAGPQLGPAAGEQLTEPADRWRYTQPRARVVGAGPVELLPQARARAPRVVAVADDGRVDVGLAIAADVQHAGALRRAHPLVKVAGVVGGAEGPQVEREHAGAWAPSTRVSTPRACRAATISAIGSTRPVGLVMWSIIARRVRGVTAARIGARTSSGPAIGNGSLARTTRAPASPATCTRALLQAL
jgi:hypothetical protein